MGRIIVSLPMHPIMLWIYLFFTIPLFILAQGVIAKSMLYLGFSRALALFIAGNMFFLSLLLSIINIKLLEIGTKKYSIVFERKYIVFFGIPVPIYSPRVVENKVIIAINLGGGLLPVIISIVLLIGLSKNPSIYPIVLLCIAITSMVTYLFSRAIPGLGIAVPGFIPPLTASILAITLLDTPWLAVPVAYISGSLGSLIGADILRLKRDLHKFVNIYGPALLSIGGAGTFDGIYLSGVLGAVITYILS